LQAFATKLFSLHLGSAEAQTNQGIIGIGSTQLLQSQSHQIKGFQDLGSTVCSIGGFLPIASLEITRLLSLRPQPHDAQKLGVTTAPQASASKLAVALPNFTKATSETTAFCWPAASTN